MADQRPQQLRLFVACALPDEMRRALGRIQDDLRSALGGGRLRWVRPEAIHVTLKFLGEVEESRVDEIASALATAVEPFELRLSASGGLGGFGGARLRVVWVGLEGDVEGLASLAGRVETALAPLGFPSERRPFAAHLTLARVPDQVPSAERRQLASLVERYRLPPPPSMVLTEVHLMRSILGPGGAVYHRLASFPHPT
jgi:2'-5' RNA ligase